MSSPEPVANPAKGALFTLVALVAAGFFAWTQWIQPFLVERGIMDPPSPDTAVVAEAPAKAPATFTAFSQCDPRWKDSRYGDGTMCANGCGPSTIANAITILTGKEVTPRETADYALAMKQYVPGYGSAGTLAPVVGKKWGIKAVAIPKTEEAVKAALKNGVVYIGGAGAKPFTPAPGHILLVRSLNEDGTVMLANSAMPDTNNRSWNLGREILPQAGTIYALSLA